MRWSPTPRSNRIAAGTIGTRVGPAGKPWPFSSSQRTTPVAASRPKALPPASRMPCTLSTRLVGLSRSVSRVPGAEPRTSTPPTTPSSVRITVQPVGRRSSVKWPTFTPGTSVMAPPSVRALTASSAAPVVCAPAADTSDDMAPIPSVAAVKSRRSILGLLRQEPKRLGRRRIGGKMADMQASPSATSRPLRTEGYAMGRIGLKPWSADQVDAIGDGRHHRVEALADG
jgi:hypothetical protein